MVRRRGKERRDNKIEVMAAAGGNNKYQPLNGRDGTDAAMVWRQRMRELSCSFGRQTADNSQWTAVSVVDIATTAHHPPSLPMFSTAAAHHHRSTTVIIAIAVVLSYVFLRVIVRRCTS